VFTTVLALFFTKWQTHSDTKVKTVVAQMKEEWCTNPKLAHWCSGHSKNNAMNNNGCEATNKVIKDEVTHHQRIPALRFAKVGGAWLKAESKRRDPSNNNPNCIQFALEHTFTTQDWTRAYGFRNNKKTQIRQVDGIYVCLGPYCKGDLTDERARKIITLFENCTFETFLEFTVNLHNAFVLHEDGSRPEGYNCTCPTNAKEFTCDHSLAVANIRGKLLPPKAAQVTLLGHKRKRGRRPQVPGAWVFQELDIGSPVAHPQQDPEALAGISGENVALNLNAELV
jgi:hypothetical protein